MRIIPGILIILVIMSGVSAESYFYGFEEALAKKIDGEIHYIYADRLGTDFETKTLPFGQNIDLGDRFGFTGKERDNSGLHYFAARYYDSNLGRFTSKDAVATEPSYQYVANDPLNSIDPTGNNMVTALIRKAFTKLFKREAANKVTEKIAETSIRKTTRSIPTPKLVPDLKPRKPDDFLVIKRGTRKTTSPAAVVDNIDMPLAAGRIEGVEPQYLARLSPEGKVLFPRNKQYRHSVQAPTSSYPQGEGKIVDGLLMREGKPARGVYTYVVDEKGGLHFFQDPRELIGHSSIGGEFVEGAGQAIFKKGKMTGDLGQAGHYFYPYDNLLYEQQSRKALYEAAEKKGLQYIDGGDITQSAVH